MSINSDDSSGYAYEGCGLNDSHEYLLPAITSILDGIKANLDGAERLFELGCGNGSIARELDQRGWLVVGVDASEQGISIARTAHPHLKLELGSAYDDLVGKYGRFPVVLSLEVVEHVYFPRKYAATIFDLLESGGYAVLSTPFHGYWKNLALALTGRLDRHFTALWDNGHIKFWSISTLRTLLEETGLRDLRYMRVGRIAPLAKSMIVVARKP